MKKYSLFCVLICFLGWIGCSSNDDLLVMPPDDDTLMPNDTMDIPDDPQTRTYSTETHVLGDWWIEIYVPSDYDSTVQYPVIYFNDGDVYADVFGVLTTLNASAFIMVGIAGDFDRAARFSPYDDPELGTFTPSADQYSDAIVNEIMPFVEDKYTINANKKALFGISLGGLHATWMAINYPQIFDFVGAISPSYWVANEALFSENLNGLDPPGLPPPTTIYYDRGTAEWRNHLSFISKLKAAGLEYGESLFYHEVIGADHFPEDWLLRGHIPFRIFMEGVSTSEMPIQFKLHSYCAFDLTNNNESTTRLNPIVQYENGVKFSVISDAEYSINQGSGSIAVDGTYTISSGSSMVVEAEYKDLTDVETVNDCN